MGVDDDVEVVFDVKQAGGDGGTDEAEHQESGDGRVGEGHDVGGIVVGELGIELRTATATCCEGPVRVYAQIGRVDD